MKKIYFFYSETGDSNFCISESKEKAVLTFFEIRNFFNNCVRKYKLLKKDTIKNYDRTLLRKDKDILIIMDKFFDQKSRENSYFFEKWNIIEKDYKEDFIF